MGASMASSTTALGACFRRFGMAGDCRWRAQSWFTDSEKEPCQAFETDVPRPGLAEVAVGLGPAVPGNVVSRDYRAVARPGLSTSNPAASGSVTQR